ncbi:MAG: ABC transporter ATP-binding protein [Actinomycetota bacterium]|nr:ABC transporter ATP-binding protein [Actinomycetota bacterium]
MPPADAPAAERPAHAAGRPVLEVRGVAVHFGGVSALTDVSLSVAAGSVTGLIGPNGAGKTTLFNVVSGLQAPNSGTVTFEGRDLARMPPHRRARLGIARTFQRLELFGTLTAEDNVRVGLESSIRWWQWRRLRASFPWAHDVSGDGARAAGSRVVSLADRLLAGVGLAGHEDQQSSAMPTGNARMVELARALAMQPKLLLLDEPGSGLDEHESEALGALLLQLAADGMAVLLVEHDMELVMRVCDRVHVLDFGHVVASGSPDEIRADPRVQTAYLGAPSGGARPPGGGR